jgi:hypothetical protein
MIIANLEDLPVYESLSYAWGDPDVSISIRLEGKHFHVTTNLESALRHIRFPDRERIMWIDAVCINQRYLVEIVERILKWR